MSIRWPQSRRSQTGMVVLVLGLLASFLAGRMVEPRWSSQSVPFEAEADGESVKPEAIFTPEQAAALEPTQLNGAVVQSEDGQLVRITASRHFGLFSFLPAVMAIGLCLTFRDPMVALLLGVISGALLLSRFDITDEVLMPSLATPGAAGLILLYLWLLGGLMGIWSRTGAAEAFAHWATRALVRGPKTAKLVAWGLGLLFFQGGTISSVLVGTAVKPIADREKISHEELSYIVDSTSAPIAILLAFNAWPIYVQALLFVPGVAVLATEQDRLGFFFRSLPLSFYALFAVLGTFLLAIDKAPILGKKMRDAIRRSRETGQLDAPDAEPLMSPELQSSRVPVGYEASVWEFVLPLLVLTVVAVGTFVVMGSPEVRWAFASAVLVAAVTALAKGMSLKQLMEGVTTGLKGVVVVSVILLLAVALGGMMKEAGAAGYLVDLLGRSIPFWILPGILFLMTLLVAFSTGTSWGTYAVAFPLAMPLAVSIGASQGLDHPELFLMICFATVLNGSVFGDQCSPISDTTVLSATTTGADLMDHVLTQLVPACFAGGLALVAWTVLVFFC